MIKERYCSLELSKLLKEKGFNEKTLAYYDDDILCDGLWFEWNRSPLGHISAPTHQMTMDWLRKKGFYIEIQTLFNEFEPSLLKFTNFHALITIIIDGRVIDEIHLTDEGIKDYGECVENAIKYCLTELIKGDKE